MDDAARHHWAASCVLAPRVAMRRREDEGGGQMGAGVRPPPAERVLLASETMRHAEARRFSSQVVHRRGSPGFIFPAPAQSAPPPMGGSLPELVRCSRSSRPSL